MSTVVVRALRILLFCAAGGAVTGCVVGLVNGFAFDHASGYVGAGFWWLAADALASRALDATRLGTLVGVVVGIAAALPGHAAALGARKWLTAGVTRLEVMDRRRFGSALYALVASVIVLVVGLWVLNTYFIPWPYSPRWWVMNVGWTVGSIIAFFVIYRLGGLLPHGEGWARRVWTIGIAKGVIAWVIALGLSGYASVTRPTAADDTPSVFLLTVDTTRADHLSCYGYERETTPNLTALAESGVLYENAFSHAAVTSASFACIMTGHRPRETGTYGNDPVALRMHTLAEYFQSAGYRTGAIVSNYVLHRGKNYEFGFDHFDDRMDDRELVRRTPERIGESTTAAALKWLRDATTKDDRPLFLWVHYQDPHGPYTPPRSYQSLYLDESARGRELRVTDSVSGSGGIPTYQVLEQHREFGYYVAQYDAEIRYFDESLHELVQGIRGMGLWDRALTIFTADHGESMGEHEYYFAHGDFLYPGQIHVPLIVWNPQEPAFRGRRDAIVQSSDIATTVLSFAGIDPVESIPGRDLLSAHVDDAVVLSETFHRDNYKCSLLTRDLQVLYDTFNDDFRAYDWRSGTFLETPGIEFAVTSADSLLARRMQEMSEGLAILRNTGARPGSGGGHAHGMSQEEIEKLKSLGYVN